MTLCCLCRAIQLAGNCVVNWSGGTSICSCFLTDLGFCRHQGAAGFGFGPAAFSSPAPNQQPGALYASPVPQNTFSSSGGNPFG